MRQQYVALFKLRTSVIGTCGKEEVNRDRSHRTVRHVECEGSSESIAHLVTECELKKKPECFKRIIGG